MNEVIIIVSIIIIIIIVIHHECDPDSPVSTLPNTLFRALPSSFRQFGLQFSTIFAILLPFILATRRSQTDFVSS